VLVVLVADAVELQVREPQTRLARRLANAGSCAKRIPSRALHEM
jgi:hypothetical protein